MKLESDFLPDIVAGCKRGDRNSQRKLYEQFYGYAMSICLRHTANHEEAVEVLNDAFFKLFTHLDSYNTMQAFKPWLRRIVVNAAIDYFRKKNRMPSYVDFTVAAEPTDEAFEIPEILPNEDMLPIVRSLPPVYRTVFNLYVMEDYSHAEIAEVLGITASSSRSNLARAVEKLRTLLADNRPSQYKTNHQ